jgi:hypothetical protein
MVKVYTQCILWKKLAKKCGGFLSFFKKLPKANNRPFGENSPNLVTLNAGRGVPKCAKNWQAETQRF